MERVKFGILSIMVLLGLGLVGYWAFWTIEPGDIHAEKQKQKELEEENLALKTEVEKLQNELSLLRSLNTEPPVETGAEEIQPNEVPPEEESGKYQTLVNELEQLIADKVVMKEKSRGTRVGTIQNFLNLYHDTSRRVDNDFGKTTRTDLISFQKAEGLAQDGQTGPSTYQKMIDWLKKQG